MRPLTASERSARFTKAEYLKPNDRLTSRERLEIYNRQYWYRLRDSLAEDFPGLKAILGERAFARMSVAYLCEFPSRSFTLRDLGSRLAGWLDANPGWAGRHRDLALDMVRLEWAHIEAFDSEELKEIGPEDLAEPNPDLRLALQPYVRLLSLQWPVDLLRATVDAAADGTRISIGGTVRSGPRALFAAVHRNEGDVFQRRLDPSEFAVLKCFERAGKLSTLLSRALRAAPMPLEDFQTKIGEWLAAWMQLGWLGRPVTNLRPVIQEEKRLRK